MIPLSDRKALIDRAGADMSICEQCSLLSINRSTLYYTPAQEPSEELEIMRALDELYTEDPSRGVRRMLSCIRAKGYKVGRYKIRRMMQKMRLKTVYCRPRTTVIDPSTYKYPYLLRNLKIERPNQAWAIDISYIPIRRGYMFLTAIIDIYSRYIVGWSLSNTMEADWVVRTLSDAIENNGRPEIINSDQGSQFTSKEYIGYIKSLQDVQISMDGKGRATDNAFIERFFRTIKHEKLYLEEFNDGHQVHKACSEFIHYYNMKREHSSLGYNAPFQRFRKVA